MLYLTVQFFLIIIFAAFIGLALGWWSRGLMADIHKDSNGLDTETDPFSARSRLEQCHRENAELRRELKETQEKATQLERSADLAHDDDIMDRLQSAESRAEALMEDLQARDDTIAVLEGELEKLR